MAKDSIEPIGQAGITSLLATIGAQLASFLAEKSIPPEDIKEASTIDGGQWKPWRHDQRTLTSAEIAQQAAMIVKR